MFIYSLCNCHREKSGLNTKNKIKHKRKMAANLPELYKNNVGPVGDRQEKERDVLYTALMPLK